MRKMQESTGRRIMPKDFFDGCCPYWDGYPDTVFEPMFFTEVEFVELDTEEDYTAAKLKGFDRSPWNPDVIVKE